jgi:hypothetical protein
MFRNLHRILSGFVVHLHQWIGESTTLKTQLPKGERCTLTIKSMGFYFIVLDSSLEVGKRFAGTRRPVLGAIPIQTNFEEIQLG